MSDASVAEAPVSLLDRLISVGTVFLDPGSVFRREARTPNAFVPFLVLAGSMVLVLFALTDPLSRVAVSAVPADLRADAAPRIDEMVRTNRWVGMALTPIVQGIRVLFLGAIVYGGALLATGGDPAFREGGYHRAVSVVVYSSFVLLAEQILTGISLWLIGWENVEYFWELKPMPGLHYLVEDPRTHHTIFAVLERFNPFTLFYGLLLAVGIRGVFRTSWSGAALISAVGVLAGIAGVGMGSLMAP